MPNCFSLYPKGTASPAILQDVDAALCAHFDTPVDPKYWFCGWYIVIGTLIAVKGLALGTPELRQAVQDWYAGPLYGTEADGYRAAMLQILDWLEARYTSNNWVEIGRRP